MPAHATASPAVVSALQAKLLDSATSLPHKYRILFSLRSVAGAEAEAAILRGLEDASELFRHEVAYCLGQRQDPTAIGVLTALLRNEAEHPMVRHEAGEALGAIGTRECLAVLADAAADSCVVVAQTCQLALQRIQHFAAAAERSGCTGSSGHADSFTVGPVYTSVDPAPPAPPGTPLAELRRTLLDEGAPVFQRYRALFALRNAGGAAAVGALGAAFGGRSALLKHEVAYVLGQMRDAAAVDTLRRVLTDGDEDAMVRHEAAEALGAIADERAVALLAAHAADPEPIVADSCVVALDMLEHERSGAFQYVDTGEAGERQPGAGTSESAEGNSSLREADVGKEEQEAGHSVSGRRGECGDGSHGSNALRQHADAGEEGRTSGAIAADSCIRAVRIPEHQRPCEGLGSATGAGQCAPALCGGC